MRPDAARGPKVVVLTTFDLDEYALAAIQAGASGFLLKDAPPEELLAAIRTVHRGDAVIAPSTTRRLLDHVAPLLRAPGPETGRHTAAVDSLTPREREVFLLIAQGLSNPEIAAQLYLSEATVKTHVGHILAKLGARDRVQAVVIAYETGLLRRSVPRPGPDRFEPRSAWLQPAELPPAGLQPAELPRPSYRLPSAKESKIWRVFASRGSMNWPSALYPNGGSGTSPPTLRGSAL